ncbi:hypothetical protein Q1695_012967 [Nippostrongylus brasiliensis]|nr:hypothetical protein Q1695_012967 [Nippostrongylus brasiliensis]
MLTTTSRADNGATNGPSRPSRHSETLIYSALFRKKFAKVFGLDSKANKCIQTCLEAESPQTSKPRVSNITFSTVTSATGLPTIAAEPSKPRSSRYALTLPSCSAC